MAELEARLRASLNGVLKKHPGQVCDAWIARPKEFVRWSLENGYTPGKNLQRRDSRKEYGPDNCFWTSVERQAHTDLFITYDGRTQSAVEWSRETGINYDTLVYRWKTGKTPEQIFSKAPLPHPGRKKRR